MPERRFVQFLHPGGEHRPDADGFISWNEGNHKRKFLRQTGRYIGDLGESPQESKLDFWGEWEPESEALRKFQNPAADEPRFVFAPFYRPRRDYTGLCNTDPCVFGGFYYCVCQQRGVMKELARGSVILFGSCKADRFVLDTVFVVAESEEYNRRNFRKLNVPDAYRDVALRPLFPSQAPSQQQCRSDESDELFKLYRGATFEHSVNSMFSFFPCLPYNDKVGFARPTIRLADFVKGTHRQNYKRSEPLDTAGI